MTIFDIYVSNPTLFQQVPPSSSLSTFGWDNLTICDLENKGEHKLYICICIWNVHEQSCGVNRRGGGMVHRNSYRPYFSRQVSSLQFSLSNKCNVLAGEQIFLAVRASSILTSQGFFVSWDSFFSTHPWRQRAPGWTGRMMNLLLEISAPQPAHCIQ